MNKIRISPYQLAAAVIICRIFTLMTHIPLIGEGHSAVSEISGAVLSAVLSCLIIIPSVYFYKNHENTGIISFISEKNHTAGISLGFVVIAALIISSAKGTAEFIKFSGTRFTGEFPKILVAFLLLSVCLYAAYFGIEGICRSTAVTLFIFVVMIIFMLYGSADKFSAENLRTGFNARDIWDSFADDFTESAELIPLIFCGKYVTEKYRGSAYLSLFGRLFVTVGVSLAALMILGDYAFISSYPFLDIGSAAGIRFFQRIDALYMVLWVITAVISISLKIFTAGEIIKEAFPQIKCENLLSAVIIFLGSLLFTYGKISSGIFYMIIFLISVLIIPLIPKALRKENRT